MNSTLHKTDREQLIHRIRQLNETRLNVWGSMTVVQMVKHCILWEEMVLQNISYKRVFAGRILGKLALDVVLKEGKPLHKNSPTIPALIIKETEGNLETVINKWVERIEQYEQFNNDRFIHPFFGKMTRDQIGRLAFKHIDHHLRQFGV